MGAGLVICAIVLAICTVTILIVVRNDLKQQDWVEKNKTKRGKK